MPASVKALASAATSARISLAILLPSRTLPAIVPLTAPTILNCQNHFNTETQRHRDRQGQKTSRYFPHTQSFIKSCAWKEMNLPLFLRFARSPANLQSEIKNLKSQNSSVPLWLE